MNPYLSVIVPAYNEEARILKALSAVYHYLKQQSYPWEILVVIDGATDQTLSVVQQFAQGKAHIRWLHRRQNRGKGYTVREGMLAATGTIRLFTDADNSTDIAHLEAVLPLFAQGYDVVICSRSPQDAPGARQAIPQTWLKRVCGILGNVFIQLVAIPGIWDTQCGFKAFSQSAAEQIFSTARINRWGFDVEALALARHFGWKIGILPAYWINDAATNVGWRSYGEVLLETVKVRWNLWRGVYTQPGQRTQSTPVARLVQAHPRSR